MDSSLLMSQSISPTTSEYLLFKVIVCQEEDRISIVHNVLSILEAQLDVFPSNNTLTALAIISSRDGYDSRRRLRPKRLRGCGTHISSGVDWG